MSPERVPRIRLAAIPGDAVLVLRGETDPIVLRSDAERFRRRFDAWGRYGVSGFLAADGDEVDVLCETRLERFAIVLVFRRADLLVTGIEVVPTFRRPHVTLAHPDVDALVSGLRSCKRVEILNPHHEGGR